MHRKYFLCIHIHLSLLFHVSTYNQIEQTSSIVLSSDSKGKEIVTYSEEISLVDLKESDIGKAIYAKVYRKWTPANKQVKPVLFCLMLINKQVLDIT